MLGLMCSSSHFTLHIGVSHPCVLTEESVVAVSSESAANTTGRVAVLVLKRMTGCLCRAAAQLSLKYVGESGEQLEQAGSLQSSPNSI